MALETCAESHEALTRLPFDPYEQAREDANLPTTLAAMDGKGVAGFHRT